MKINNKFILSLIGKIINDKYTVISQIGMGGMGFVLKVQDKNNIFYAMKILKPEIHDIDIIDRFEIESKIMLSINHPNIIKVYDSGYYNNIPYFIMEYIDGTSLDELIMLKKKLSWRKGLIICREIDKALRYAHSMGVIHRDIKPSNILITKDHKIKLTDFGLAKVRNSTIITTTGTVMGTPAYMSPEQWVSDGPISYKTDYYSLGAVLYHIITGKTPLNGNTPQSILEKIINKEPIIIPSDISSDIPAFIDKMCMEMLIYTSEERKEFPEELVNKILNQDEKTIEELYISHEEFESKFFGENKDSKKQINIYNISTLLNSNTFKEVYKSLKKDLFLLYFVKSLIFIILLFLLFLIFVGIILMEI